MIVPPVVVVRVDPATRGSVEADPALVACVAAGRPCLASYLVEEGAGDSATMRIEMVFGAPSTEGRRSTFLLAAAVAFGSAALVCAVVALVVLAG